MALRASSPASPVTGATPPSGGYGAPPPGSGAAPRNGLGIAALVLGLLALFSSWTVVGGIVFGLLAIILGIIGRSRAKRGEANNGGLALAGIILGVLGLLLSIAFIAGIASLLGSDTVQDLQDCIEQAATDAEVQQCQTDLEDDLGG
jgi:hypothetical protein